MQHFTAALAVSDLVAKLHTIAALELHTVDPERGRGSSSS